MDIDQFFTLGPDGPFRAHQVFTNRDTQLETLRRRLASHAGRSWPIRELLDPQRAVANVTAFVGEGGIGKSTLVRHAVKLAVGGEGEELPEHRAAAVIDFDDTASSSFESIVLRVRAALAPLCKRWPAFDIALAVYWERKHPGESLTAFLDKSTLSGSRRMAEQVGGALDELLGGFGLVSVAYRAVELLGSSAVKANRLKRLRQELPALQPILDEPDPDRMLGYLPVLLAADLERGREQRPALAICLLDTFEVVQRRPAEKGGLEDLVSRLVYLMPNVFFAVASRRPLQWHEPVRSVGLTYGGESRWPGLAGEDQHPLDGFTAADAERAERVLTAVRHLTAVATSVWDDTEDGLPLRERCLRSVAAFLLGLHASHEHGVAPDGLGLMAYTLREVGHWQVLTSLPDYADRPDLARLAAVARLAADPERNAAEGYDAMRAAAGDELTDYVRFELGSRAHFIGELDAADRYFEEITADGSPLADGALFGLGGNAMRRSQYARVTELMERAPKSRLDRIRVADMLGHVQLHNARFEASAALFTEALEQAERANAPLWGARAARHLALAYMWYDPRATLELVPRARELNYSAGELNGVAQCDQAAATAYALRGEWDTAAELLATARRRFAERGATRELLPVDPVEVLHLCARGRREEAVAITARLAAAQAAGTPECVPVWVAVCALWTERPDLCDFGSIGWLDSPEQARRRWSAPLRQLREAVWEVRPESE